MKVLKFVLVLIKAIVAPSFRFSCQTIRRIHIKHRYTFFFPPMSNGIRMEWHLIYIHKCYIPFPRSSFAYGMRKYAHI